MNITRWVLIAQLFYSPFVSAADAFIPSGKWELNNGSYICVSEGNVAPDPSRLAMELAATTGTGSDVVSTCHTQKYMAQEHSFSAVIMCRDVYVSGHVDTNLTKVTGKLSTDKRSYTVSTYPKVSGQVSGESVYTHVSDQCLLDTGTVVDHNTASVEDMSRDFLQFLYGLPEGASVSVQ